MKIFLKHYGDYNYDPSTLGEEMSSKDDVHLNDMEKIIDVLCDEEAIDNS